MKNLQILIYSHTFLLFLEAQVIRHCVIWVPGEAKHSGSVLSSTFGIKMMGEKG